MEMQQQHDANDLAERRFGDLAEKGGDELQSYHGKVMEEHFAKIRAVLADCAAGTWRDAASEGATAQAQVPIDGSGLRLASKEWRTAKSS
jgi:hypothetical protein